MPYWIPKIIHCHDYHAGLVFIFLKIVYNGYVRAKRVLRQLYHLDHTEHNALLLHYNSGEFVRILLLQTNKDYVMVVTKVLEDIDLYMFKQYCGAEQVRIVPDHELTKIFPDCDPTALPSIGQLFGLDVYCSDKLCQNKAICFNPGTHDQIIRIATKEFLQVTNAQIGDFTRYPCKSSRYEFCFQVPDPLVNTM
jgi:Ala-tRNA(Pro) deacylase